MEASMFTDEPLNVCGIECVEYLQYQSCFGSTELRREVNLCNETLNTKTSSARALSNSKERRQKFCE